jgi:hypothetical protein
MKYDDAEYLFLNFETERANDDAGTHIGMYLGWAILRGLGGEPFSAPEAASHIQRLKAREITGAEVLWDRCDGKLTDDDFNAVGNAFTAAYYENFFTRDYERVFQRDIEDTGHPTDDFCSVPDTWANFERMAAVLDQRFAQWQKSPPQPAAPVAAASAASAATKPALELEPMDNPAEAQGRPSLDELQQRAKAGDREAWFELGAEYITGERVAQDVAMAAKAFQHAAKLGQVDAQFNLGVCYQNGDGMPKSASQALHWFSQAAEGGHPEGLYMLGMAYRNGAGVPQDLGASNALLLLGRAKGSANAARAGIMAGSGGYVDLLEQISQPGKLLSTLAARRGANAGSGGTASSFAPASNGSTARTTAPPPRRVPVVQPGNAPDTASVDALAVLATAIGASAVFVLLLMAGSVSGPPFKYTAVVFAAFGAFGTWRLSTAMNHGPLRRLMLTLCAGVPVAGSFLCMLMLKWRWLG